MAKRNSSNKKIPFLISLALIIIGMWYFMQQEDGNSKSDSPTLHEIEQPSANENSETPIPSSRKSSSGPNIKKLTREERIVDYLKEHQELPDIYITKNKAKKLGWKPQKGNLCDVLPGKAIGGDHFGNREGRLPNKNGRKYYEADINYDCGRRGADRLVYSNDGLVFITKDHYKTFDKQ